MPASRVSTSATSRRIAPLALKRAILRRRLDGEVPTRSASWRDGMGEGEWLYFHTNGLIRARSWVSKDIWHGPSEGWHTNGAKAFEGILNQVYHITPIRRWDDTGNPRGPWADLARPDAGAVRAIGLPDWPEGLNRWDFNFTRDLETLFFATGNDDGSQRRVMMRRWRSAGWQDGAWQPGAWGAPEPAPFSDGAAAEGTPVVSYDGEWVYFSSDRHAAVCQLTEQAEKIYDCPARLNGWQT